MGRGQDRGRGRHATPIRSGLTGEARHLEQAPFGHILTSTRTPS